MVFWNIYCTYIVIILLGASLLNMSEGYANKHKNKKEIIEKENDEVKKTNKA